MDSSNSIVNDLLVQVHRSLLQYAAESWPWAALNDLDTEQHLLMTARRQEQVVGRMVAFLKERKHPIDFGVYPYEYTSLHFVSLGFFLNRLRESEAAVLGELESALSQLADDSECLDVVQDAIGVQKDVVKSLSEFKISNSEVSSSN
ncbi:hypothetical protein AB1L42_06310 [Thalassoglobus sp. JC818]|uniref:hypothetical protein n=1 Tax=Thalassoglobus sp. JC818 TaxID=3232136 RepID=UPI00345AB96D